MIHDSLKLIQDYTTSVENGTLVCHLKGCPHCGRCPDGGFTRHDSRTRTFLAVVERVVVKILSALTRWKCPLCGRKFTYYPDFAVRHKRYVQEAITDRSFRYVEDPKATYRSVVREEKTAVGYASTDDGTIDERQLVPSTVHRWLTALGSLRESLRLAYNLIKSRSPASSMFRHIFPLPARKYRSDERRQCLQTCRRFFRADRECRRLSFPPIIPDLATACGWT